MCQDIRALQAKVENASAVLVDSLSVTATTMEDATPKLVANAQSIVEQWYVRTDDVNLLNHCGSGCYPLKHRLTSSARTVCTGGRSPTT